MGTVCCNEGSNGYNAQPVELEPLATVTVDDSENLIMNDEDIPKKDVKCSPIPLLGWSGPRSSYTTMKLQLEEDQKRQEEQKRQWEQKQAKIARIQDKEECQGKVRFRIVGFFIIGLAMAGALTISVFCWPHEYAMTPTSITTTTSTVTTRTKTTTTATITTLTTTLATSLALPALTTVAATTTIITTLSQAAAGWPSFFCFEVARAQGYETDLVKNQLLKHASIFGCNEYTVFSNGGTIDLSETWKTSEIHTPPLSMGKGWVDGQTTSSWLNTLVFMKAWQHVLWDGRFRKYDWTVKADPDTVFIPERLRAKLRAHTTNGASLFVMNCDRFGSIAMYGSLEVISRMALETYFNSAKSCEKDLNWHGWGEDYYMQTCLQKLGVGSLNGFDFIADNRCRWAPCTDTSKVAFHDFKDVNSYFQCWGQSTQQW